MQTNIQQEIENARQRLDLLDRIDRLDQQFRFEKNEYLRRRQQLSEQLQGVVTTEDTKYHGGGIQNG